MITPGPSHWDFFYGNADLFTLNVLELFWLLYRFGTANNQDNIGLWISGGGPAVVDNW